MKTQTQLQFINGFGIIDAPNQPRTYLGWLLHLARNHGAKGMRYAVGLKINHAVLQNDGVFKEFCPNSHVGFRAMAIEMLDEDFPHSASFRKLLETEFRWAVRYLKKELPDVVPSRNAPVPLPGTFTELNLKLALDFNGAGLPYAIRYFTSPGIKRAQPPCLQDGYAFGLFADQILKREDIHSKRFQHLMTLPEFAEFAHLAKAPFTTIPTAVNVLNMTES